jgi:hypothetical protein
MNKGNQDYKKLQRQDGHLKRIVHFSIKLFKKMVDGESKWFRSHGSTFRHNPPKTPNRNSPCDCGSGKKYRNCCGTHRNLKCFCGGKTKAYYSQVLSRGFVRVCVDCGHRMWA